MKNNTIVNGVINGNLEAFIIPNKATAAEDWLIPSQREKMMARGKEIAELSGKEFDAATDKLVQLWFVGMGSENLVDHGAMVEDEAGNKYVLTARIEHLPVSLFAGHKEGETIELRLPATCRRQGESIDVILNVNVKLNQHDYRYRRFGAFEDVLQSVVA